MKYLFIICMLQTLIFSIEYNHPEFNWFTIETENFKIHYHEETERTAFEATTVAETIFDEVTNFYDYKPKEKTHLILIDPDDYSNGAAYYYDNKIIIWASPLDFELRGSHRWLQNVITHEFVHIVSLQKSMKMGTRIPGLYFQYMNYEKEKRPDVLYGYPNRIISYPIPGTSVPPWLAEGTAQYMYDSADWDHWDSHRDMILRDRTLNKNLLSFNEMNTFGKKGIGNESTYNAGFALCTYIANQYGSESLKNIMIELSSPFQFSIDKAIYNVVGKSGEEVFKDFKLSLEMKYQRYNTAISVNIKEGKKLESEGTSNLYPKWNPKENGYSFLSNKRNDFFSQTDLFYHNLDDSSEIKIQNSIHSATSWHSNGEIIYYSKKSKFPNKFGSKYYDIYSYNLVSKDETRLTHDARAFNPVFVEKDSSIYYLATFDGGQNIYKLNLKTSSSKKMTHFDNDSILSFLNYSKDRNSLFYDITNHHYRDIGKYDLINNINEIVYGETTYDERNIGFGPDGESIHSIDKNGIYNLYITSKDSNKTGYITNVRGGAFMPDISLDGQILYSQYKNGKYVISYLNDCTTIEDDYVGYSSKYHNNNSNHKTPIIKHTKINPQKYIDQFPEMFIMPKLMIDYNTLKPGFYFSSSEIINRLSLFGGGSINRINDLDLYFILDFKRFYPTLFFESFYLTRNTTDNSLYQGVYSIEDDIKFRLVQFRSGLKIPFFGTKIELSGSRQWYRAFINQAIPQENLEAGVAYDYYKGWIYSANWDLDMVKRSLNKSINPEAGFYVGMKLDIEKNQFIEGLNLSDSGTLTGDYGSNNLTRFQLNTSYHRKIPGLNKNIFNFTSAMSITDNENVDSFFHTYLGGMSGLKGYPFYSIQGTKSWMIDITIRRLIMTNKNYKFNWLIFQNSTLAGIFQIGDAWTRNNTSLNKLKKSIGMQWRLNGFSFYNYPTAIELEYHHPLDKFERIINDDIILYGQEGRTYVKILFDF